jgi:hypothetical protein
MANPKFIIAAGCSFTEYPQDERFKNWPGHLSQYLDCEHTSYFLGTSSADNSYIANRTLYTVTKLDKNLYNDILVGVMWSGVNRKSFYLTEAPDNYSKTDIVNPTGYIDKNYYFVGPSWNDELAKTYYKYYYDKIGSLIESLKNVLLLQNFLKVNNIKYFFTEYSYDCISMNKFLTHPEVEFFYRSIDKTNFLPVKNMSEWIDNNTNFQYYIDDTHPTPIMSKEFTYKVIIPHLKSMGYIS